MPNYVRLELDVVDYSDVHHTIHVVTIPRYNGSNYVVDMESVWSLANDVANACNWDSDDTQTNTTDKTE